jgi:hypothetical protein
MELRLAVLKPQPGTRVAFINMIATTKQKPSRETLPPLYQDIALSTMQLNSTTLNLMRSTSQSIAIFPSRTKIAPQAQNEIPPGTPYKVHKDI